MSLLLESIKVLDGTVFNIEYHNRRLNASRRKLFGATDPLELRRFIPVRDNVSSGLWKCRVIYGGKIESVEFLPYIRKAIRSLTLMESDTIDYPHKFVDRSAINELLIGIKTDDILIVKNGLITDASYANVVFHDGKNWLTPSTPLLPGTARARLLDQGRIMVEEIRVSELRLFKKCALINAMLDLDEESAIVMDAIISAK